MIARSARVSGQAKHELLRRDSLTIARMVGLGSGTWRTGPVIGATHADMK